MSKSVFSLCVRAHIASYKLFFFFKSEYTLSAFPGFLFTIEIGIDFAHSDFRSMSDFVYETFPTFLFSSLCISSIANIQTLENATEHDWIVLEECNVQTLVR